MACLRREDRSTKPSSVAVSPFCADHHDAASFDVHALLWQASLAIAAAMHAAHTGPGHLHNVPESNSIGRVAKRPAPRSALLQLHLEDGARRQQPANGVDCSQRLALSSVGVTVVVVCPLMTLVESLSRMLEYNWVEEVLEISKT